MSFANLTPFNCSLLQYIISKYKFKGRVHFYISVVNIFFYRKFIIKPFFVFEIAKNIHIHFWLKCIRYISNTAHIKPHILIPCTSFLFAKIWTRINLHTFFVGFNWKNSMNSINFEFDMYIVQVIFFGNVIWISRTWELIYPSPFLACPCIVIHFSWYADAAIVKVNMKERVIFPCTKNHFIRNRRRIKKLKETSRRKPTMTFFILKPFLFHIQVYLFSRMLPTDPFSVKPSYIKRISENSRRV